MIGNGKKHAFRNGWRRRASGTRRLCMEMLEPRLALTWAGVPPTSISPPASAVAVALVQNDASGAASIATTEIDYYSFTAGASGSYVISATTPSSSLDTVLGVFSSTGQRLSYNDDISYPSNTDSRVTINLTAGTRYYVGITNYTSSSRGAYSWSIDGPAVTTTPTDDAYENNDTLATAYNLGTLTATQTVSSLGDGRRGRLVPLHHERDRHQQQHGLDQRSRTRKATCNWRSTTPSARCSPRRGHGQQRNDFAQRAGGGHVLCRCLWQRRRDESELHAVDHSARCVNNAACHRVSGRCHISAAATIGI